MTDQITDLHIVGAGATTQCFAINYYSDGDVQTDNITDWALGEFQKVHGTVVTKEDIFYYVYAILHHPTYRERYAENLKRELPRIPVEPSTLSTKTFADFVDVGRALADVHLSYETADEYPLKQEYTAQPFSWRVEKMKLSKDKTSLILNETLTLHNIPQETYHYRLGNRSALEWIIDQYQVSTDKRSGLTSDPNRAEEPEYIIRLIGRIITVSLKTNALIAQLTT